MAFFDATKKDDQIKKLEKEIAKLKELASYKEESSDFEEKEDLNDKNKLFEWNSPVRVYIKREREWYITVILWVIFFLLIMLFFHEYMLMLATVGLTFLAFVLSKIPPGTTKHIIYTKGIESFDKFYSWEDLKDFWVNSKHDQYTITVATKVRFPTALIMIVSKEDLKRIVNILNKKLVYKELKREQNWISKLTDGIFIKYEDIKSFR